MIETFANAFLVQYFLLCGQGQFRKHDDAFQRQQVDQIFQNTDLLEILSQHFEIMIAFSRVLASCEKLQDFGVVQTGRLVVFPGGIRYQGDNFTFFVSLYVGHSRILSGLSRV